MNKQQAPSLANMGITTLILIAGLVFGFVALNTQDLLWFAPTFKEQPRSIVINCYGEKQTLKATDPRFSELVSVINDTLSGKKNWDSLTLSDETYQEYQTSPKMMVIELHYSPPVRIHSTYKFFSGLDTLIIPLDGRHATTNAVFGRSNNFNTSGSLHYAGIPDIRTFVESQGICLKP